jgi:hypothetical protein
MYHVKGQGAFMIAFERQSSTPLAGFLAEEMSRRHDALAHPHNQATSSTFESDDEVLAQLDIHKLQRSSEAEKFLAQEQLISLLLVVFLLSTVLGCDCLFTRTPVMLSSAPSI